MSPNDDHGVTRAETHNTPMTAKGHTTQHILHHVPHAPHAPHHTHYAPHSTRHIHSKTEISAREFYECIMLKLLQDVPPVGVLVLDLLRCAVLLLLALLAPPRRWRTR